MNEKKMTIEELALASGKSKSTIYNLAKKLGRIPTLEEVQTQKRGRPQKYEQANQIEQTGSEEEFLKKQAIQIAQTGAIEEKEAFVEWCCDSIAYLSSQCAFNPEAAKLLAEVQSAYKAYLKAMRNP